MLSNSKIRSAAIDKPVAVTGTAVAEIVGGHLAWLWLLLNPPALAARRRSNQSRHCRHITRFSESEATPS
jgi:drug/metabolite transporter superfamily protein YnfA